MRIFVTGVAGFLGSHLAEHLLEEGHEVVGCDNLIGGEIINVPPEVEFYQYDCTDRNSMARISRGCEVAFHCAATAYEGLSVFSPSLVIKNIVDASASVFSAAIENRVRRIIFCSSMARYGTNQVPFREDYEPRPQDPYGIAKVCAETLLRNLCEVHRVEHVIAVPHNIIGPRQKFDDPYRNVASIMINLMLQGRQPIIYGDGEQKRCFSFIDDCLSCLMRMIDAEHVDGEIINIGPDVESFITINQLCRTIADIIGFDCQPNYVEGRPQEVKLATCSADKARRLLGYRTKVDLRTGLRSMVQHIAARGPRKFRYHLELEIINQRTPRTWRERMF